MGPPKPNHKPINAYRMTATLKNFAYKLSSTLSSSEVPTLKKDGEFSKARKTEDLFPTTDPTIDGDDCLHDCATCTIKYPRKFEIDEAEELYGHVKGWQTHLIVATGKTDWVRDVADEKGSIMEAVDRGNVKPSNGVSNQSNIIRILVILTTSRNSCSPLLTCLYLIIQILARGCYCCLHGSLSTTSRLLTYPTSSPAT
jgi:hypothetical protein